MPSQTPYILLLSRCLLAAILLAACVSVMRTTLTSPIGRGPDEFLHFEVVQYIAQARALPIAMMPVGLSVASQETAQAPFYYMLAALLAGWSTQPWASQRLAPPLSFLLHQADRLGYVDASNRAFFRAPREWWPQATVVSGFVARGVSILLLPLSIVVLYILLRQAGLSLPIALAGTAWLAWNENYIFFYGYVTPDALLGFMSAVTLLLAFRVTRPAPPRYTPLLLGICSGLLLLTKLSGLILAPAVFLALLCMPQPLPQRLKTVGLVGLVALVVCGWWLVRNIWLYGDPLAQNIFMAIESSKGGIEHVPLTLGRVRELLTRAYNTFRTPPWDFFPWVSLAAVPGLFLAAREKALRPLLLVSLATLLAGLAAYIYWANQFVYGWHSRIVLPIWPALALLWGIGISRLIPRQWQAVVPLLVFVLWGHGLLQHIIQKPPANAQEASYYFLLSLEPDEHLPWQDPALAQFGDAFALRGAAAQYGPHDVLVNLVWQAQNAIPGPDDSLFLHLQDNAGRPLSQVDTYQLTETPPLSAWRRGQVAVFLAYFPLSAAGPRPLLAYLGFYNRQTLARYPVNGGDIPGIQDHYLLPLLE